MDDFSEYIKSSSLVYIRKISNQRNYALIHLYLYEQDKKGKELFKISEIANDLKMDRAYIYQVIMNMRNFDVVQLVNTDKTIKITLDKDFFNSENYKDLAVKCLNKKK